jgi:hypothetical protein
MLIDDEVRNDIANYASLIPPETDPSLRAGFLSAFERTFRLVISGNAYDHSAHGRKVVREIDRNAEALKRGAKAIWGDKLPTAIETALFWNATLPHCDEQF